MKTYIYSTAVETARALIKHLISLMEEEPQKIFHIAFSGGSTPSLMFDLWAYLLGGRTVCTCRRFGE